jgi:hypothetical protein
VLHTLPPTQAQVPSRSHVKGTAGKPCWSFMYCHTLPGFSKAQAGTVSYPEAYFKIRAPLELSFHHHQPTGITQVTVTPCHAMLFSGVCFLCFPAYCCWCQWTRAHNVIMPDENPAGWLFLLFLLVFILRHDAPLDQPEQGSTRLAPGPAGPASPASPASHIAAPFFVIG